MSLETEYLISEKMLDDIYTISYFLSKYGNQQKPHWEQLHRNEQEIYNVITLVQTNKQKNT